MTRAPSRSRWSALASPGPTDATDASRRSSSLPCLKERKPPVGGRVSPLDFRRLSVRLLAIFPRLPTNHGRWPLPGPTRSATANDGCAQCRPTAGGGRADAAHVWAALLLARGRSHDAAGLDGTDDRWHQPSGAAGAKIIRFRPFAEVAVPHRVAADGGHTRHRAAAGGRLSSGHSMQCGTSFSLRGLLVTDLVEHNAAVYALNYGIPG
ncbi:hypothetical protein U1Q18_051634 [Sarracenia purpurea var. burkii]